MGKREACSAQSGGRDDAQRLVWGARCARGGLASRRLSSVERSGGSCLACGGCPNRESSYTGAEGCEEAGKQNKRWPKPSPKRTVVTTAQAARGAPDFIRFGTCEANRPVIVISDSSCPSALAERGASSTSKTAKCS